MSHKNNKRTEATHYRSFSEVTDTQRFKYSNAISDYHLVKKNNLLMYLILVENHNKTTCSIIYI